MVLLDCLQYASKVIGASHFEDLKIDIYSAVSNIGYIWCLKEGSYETWVVLQVD
jgi:hypothetical protein